MRVNIIICVYPLHGSRRKKKTLIDCLLLWSDPLWCLVSGAAFGTVGYWLAGVDERNTALLQERKRLLLENRARAEEIYARRQAEQQQQQQPQH
jgi:hypothetical protein